MNTWLLPDGINESLPDEAEKLEALRRHIVDLYATWGYRLVMPPLVEYMESLKAGMGTQLDLQTFKITDQENGRMMGIRADITPQVARIDAHRLSNDDNAENPSINRLCYMGTVLRTRSDEQGGSRSPVQVGAELFGHAGIESDSEIISLMLATLDSLDIKDLVLDLGHVGLASGLADYAQLNDSQRSHYFDMLSRKSIPEIESWVAQLELASTATDMLLALPMLSGSPDIIDSAKVRLKNAGKVVLDALDHLQKISRLLSTNYPELTLHIDLAEMRGYAYHTGILYTVYQTGCARSIAQGGRYDGIGKAFGNSRPAIGFSSDLRTLADLSFATTQLINTLGVNGILIPNIQDQDLELHVNELRAQGEQVIRYLACADEADLSAEQLKSYGCNRILHKQNNTWVVKSLS
jgi:ATP phosphoribosyltransferase regulatory subunit